MPDADDWLERNDLLTEAERGRRIVIAIELDHRSCGPSPHPWCGNA
jgi:hypothetical protein